MQHYRSYQGRRTSHFRGFLKGVAIALVLVVLLLLACTVLLQRYVVYGDDGIRLELPWTNQEEEQPSPSVSVSPPPIIKEENPADAVPSPELPDPHPMLHAVYSDIDALLSGTVGAAPEAVGADAVILTMKDDSGELNYVSANELAVYVGSSAADPAGFDIIHV